MDTENKVQLRPFTATVTYTILAVDHDDALSIAGSVVLDATSWLWPNHVPDGDVVRVEEAS